MILGAVVRGSTSARGLLVVRGGFSCSETTSISAMLVSVGYILATLVSVVFSDTTGWSSNVHQSGSTEMVGGVAPETTFREEATNFPSGAFLLVK